MEIVRNGELWASNLRYMNDSTEFAFVLDIIRNRVGYLWEQSEDENESKALHQLLRTISESKEMDAYVISFSERRDDLSQWRGYCPPGLGVCIGFKSSVLHEIAFPTPKRRKTSLDAGISQFGKVIYLDKNSGESFDGMIKRVLSKDLESLASMEQTSVLYSIMTGFAPFYKSNTFEDEAEWRLQLGHSFKANKPTKIGFRIGKSTLIPYAVLDISAAGGEYISEVIVGPSPNLDLTVEAVKEFLASEGRPQISVVGTDVPYRHW